MKLLQQTITSRQTLTIVVAGVFLFSAVFSISLGMQSDAHGTMYDCPFVSLQTSLCQMGILEHIAKWQQLFTAVFSKSATLTSVLLLLLTLAALATFAREYHNVFFARTLSPPIPKSKPGVKLFNYLVVAFAEGILHSKVYA